MPRMLAILLPYLLCLVATAQTPETPKKTNRLAGEKSPYLRQHATNPVDWRPWSEAAFEEAKKRDVPVFLSIGYSTCHWCHVMEHESFENAEIAKLMNDSFVCVKLDREERPDIDAVYMKSVQIITRGAGGWPASIWMFPDKRVFFAGTYFPPENFSQLIGKINAVWKTKREALTTDAEALIEEMRSLDATFPSKKLPGLAAAGSAAEILRARHDAAYGGFGRAPKFPRTSVHELLFAETLASAKPDYAAAALHSLAMMARGGIRDHVGGGFHRYSVDREWLVPHFEKMLYDQALIAATYLDAAIVSEDDVHFDVARDILECLARDFTHEDGGLYCAYDADSGGVEGSYYVWSPETLGAALAKEELRVALARFDVTEAGNWHELEGQSILRVRQTWEEVAKELDADVVRVRALWEGARPKLRKARDLRPRPGLDDKILVAWNGMAISALARAGRLLENPEWVERAARAAEFIHEHMRTEEGRLLRRWCDGESAHRAVLRDYAFYGQGLVDLFEATGDFGWITRALSAADTMLADFAAEGGGFYDAPASADDLLLRPRDPYDGAIPSGNSTAAALLLRLGALTGRKDLREAGLATLRAFAAPLARHPAAHPKLLEALRLAHTGVREIVIIGDPDHEETRAMRRVIAATWLPDAVLCLADEAQARAAEKSVPLFASRSSADGSPTAWVCRDGVCKLPVKTAERLRALLTEDAQR